MHHIMDASYWETPFGTIHLPEAGSWMVGPVDMTPTKHVLFMLIAAAVMLLLFLPAAAAVTRVELDTSVQANATSTTQDG